MTTPQIASSVAAAEAAIAEGQYKSALIHCKAALKADRNSLDALLLVGKAACCLNEFSQGELAYRRALEVQPGLLPAWEGLADMFAACSNVQGEIEANEHLLQLTTEEDPRDRAARLRLTEAYFKNGDYDSAAQQLKQMLDCESTSNEERISLLCRLADVMLKRDQTDAAAALSAHLSDSMSPSATPMDGSLPAAPPTPPADSLAERTISCIELDVLAAQAVHDELRADELSVSGILKEIAETAPPAYKYLPYREEHLRRCLLRIFYAPPRSTDRQHFRLTALRECVAVICQGGACSPLGYEAAVWLLEEEEEITGGQVSVGGQEVGGTQALASGVQAGAEGHIGSGRHATVAYAAENFSRRMIHQFPTNPTSRVMLALMRRRHALQAKVPVPQAERRQLERLLADAMDEGAHTDSASGFKALAELQYENRRYDDAVATSLRGLRWLQERRQRGHEALTQVALGLRLVLAKSLRRLGKLDEAERHFKSMAGWVSEGEAAFAEMSGSAPTSIHQQALRGIALVALARGDKAAARAQYERILGKAGLGRGPAEHWAHADYGWLLYQDGDMQNARHNLEQALQVAEEEGCAATDSQVGEHRYRLGEVYWKLKGRYRTDKQFAYLQFLEAAKVEGHAQAPALAALGRYFEEIEHRSDAAQRCFKKALAIDPSVDLAGDGLCAYLQRQGRTDAAIDLCREVASRAPQAPWSQRRLGLMLIEQRLFSEAVTALQAALRADPGDASTWEALGAAYQPQGRLTAALKAYSRALELEPTRMYALIQSGNLHLALGSPSQALECHERALAASEADHPAALLGAAEALATSASANIRLGALVAASKELERATFYALSCTQKHGTLVSSWKQLGDVLLLQRAVPPAGGGSALHIGNSDATAALASWQGRIDAVESARRAYSKALHLTPWAPNAWQDAAASFYHERQLRRAHPAVLNDTINTCGAERLLRGALRLDPTSPELWLALGLAARDTAAGEFALSRSLQLDPRSSTAWVALARVYIDSGERGLAERCLQQGRSQDPAAASIWEAMASLAALTESSHGEKERNDFAEHAVGLGAGAEGLLTFAEASLVSGKGNQGEVYAAARRAAELLPLEPAAWNTWGLACEAKGDSLGAVKAYRSALELLQVQGRGDGNGDQPIAERIPSTSRSGVSLSGELGVRLNLARALSGAGLFPEAVALYNELESQGALMQQPHAWLSFAVALAEGGDIAGAEKAAGNALASASESDSAAAVAAVEAQMQLKCLSGKPQDALYVLEGALSHLERLGAPTGGIGELWILCAAAAAVADPVTAGHLLPRIVYAAKAWAASSDRFLDDAPFMAKLQGMQATALRIQGQGSEGASAMAAKAVFTCPWANNLRIDLATAAMDASQGNAEAVLRVVDATRVDLVADDPQCLNASLSAAARAALATCVSTCKTRSKKLLARVAAAVHVDPTDPLRWYVGALLAAQVAAAAGTRSAHLTALGWCHSALALQGAHDAESRSRLLVCVSECLLHLGEDVGIQSEDKGRALTSAKAAVQSALSDGARAEALRQLARCYWASGDIEAAREHFNQAVSLAGPGGAALASLELARMLETNGHKKEAVECLESKASHLQTLSTTISAVGEPPRSEQRRKQLSGLSQLMLLRSSRVFARMGELEQAKLAAEGADVTGGSSSKDLALVARGAACLQLALQPGRGDEARAEMLGEARRSLGEAVQSGQDDNTVVRVLQAQVEHAGTFRKKEERVAAHVEAALKHASRPVPADILLLLAGLLDSPAMHAKAVHAAPWERAWWSGLQLQSI